MSLAPSFKMENAMQVVRGVVIVLGAVVGCIIGTVTSGLAYGFWGLLIGAFLAYIAWNFVEGLIKDDL